MTTLRANDSSDDNYERTKLSLFSFFFLFFFVLDQEIGDYDSTIDPRDVRLKVVKTLAS